jgi:hypothetical protein
MQTEIMEPVTIIDIPGIVDMPIATLEAAVLRDPIAALVSIQTKGDRAETLAIRELCLSVVGVPESNVIEMVKEYKKQASLANWAASTLKVRASNLKGVLECARINSGFADLVALQEACGLQRAYAMRAEFLKAINGTTDGEDSDGDPDGDPDEGVDDALSLGITATGAYVQALAKAVICAEVLKRHDDVKILRDLMAAASIEQ